MRAFIEVLSGVVRVGNACEKYGDKFDFAVAFSSIDGKTAIIKALVRDEQGTKLKPSHLKAVVKTLGEIGLTADWERVK